jgi:hypothetical protein
MRLAKQIMPVPGLASTTAAGLVVHDLLAVGRTDVSHRRAEYRRGPADFGATGVLLRTATCIGGEVEVMADCAPLFGRSCGAADSAMPTDFS